MWTVFGTNLIYGLIFFFLMKAIEENIVMQITNATQMIKLEKDPHAAFALIIDGKTLTHTLEDDIKHQFLNLAVGCASVICCRVSPKQKALVRHLYLRIFLICYSFMYHLDILLNIIKYQVIIPYV